MQLSELLTDDLAEKGAKAIRAAMKKAGVTSDLTFFELHSRLRVQDHALFLVLLHPVVPIGAERPISMVLGLHPWLDNRPVLHKLADGLALWFSDENPELELARRRHVLAEEERRREVKSWTDVYAENARRRAEEREATRVAAWRRLPAAVRAATRLSPSASVMELANALAAEAAGSLPPDGWEAPQ